jgi:hypothetical protein
MDVVGLPHSIIFQAEGDPEMADVVFNEDSDGGSVDSSIAITLPAKTLPLSLTHLQLRICNERTFSFLYLITLVPIEWIKLQDVECHFPICARTGILLCELGDGQLLDYVKILRNLETMGINVDFYTGSREKLTDMRRELTLQSLMPPSAACVIALAGKQFSDLALTVAKRLKSSAVDCRLFARHGIDHFGLLNSPTFNGRSWTNVAFFHGTKNTRHDHRIRPRKMHPGLPFNRADLGLPIMKLRRGKVLDLNQTQLHGIHPSRRNGLFMSHPRRSCSAANPSQ